MSNKDEAFPGVGLNILLADDDKDDCFLFDEALKDLGLETSLTLVYDGEQLMHLLKKRSIAQFDVLFLDLNMPRKSGFECLEEIKSIDALRSLPVIILSTSFDQRFAEILYKNGAMHFISKPSEFSELREVIRQALLLVTSGSVLQPPREKFLLRSSERETVFA